MDIRGGYYRTGEVKRSFLSKLFPTIYFYPKLFKIILDASSLAQRDRYGDEQWVKSSDEIFRLLEQTGCRIEIEGVENFCHLTEPVVFIGNHMSTFETFVLPGIINTYKKVTFVVKKSLVEYPIFKHVINSRQPIVVTRENPREDLKTVLNEGVDRVQKGFSIVVFPQTTRTTIFDSSQFNTIGIKLAKKAGVKIIPVAVKTDAWSNGKRFKDFGKIYPERDAHFAFGKPMEIVCRGDEEHEQVIEFIKTNLLKWGLSPE